MPRVLAIVALLPLAGCVERTISITSDPAGALVLLNDREIGRTPVEVEFTFYGTYDVRLSLEGYEPLVTSAEAKPPWWDNAGPDLFAELAPGRHQARVEWHFVLEPERREGLRDRAAEFRERSDNVGEDK